MAMLVFTLHLLDRQIEHTSRLDFIWKQKFKVEKEEVETMGSLNKILLENILPAHVADHFLKSGRRFSEELYYETYKGVCVMFASIPNFKEFWIQNDINNEGLECLRLLNEIIADFDLLLSKPKFSSIEKIKTIGSTYMAACGLQPGREDGQRMMQPKQEQYVICMTDFVMNMFHALDGINRDSFNQFQLRVGLNYGPAIAGVIGAQKPQYDIWGNTVNVASRMDSCGVHGKVQVPEDTAMILIGAGYGCDCRGKIYVKGKGEMTTYLLGP